MNSQHLISSESIRVSSMPKAVASDGRNIRYRQRLRASGAREVLFQMPDEMLALIDDIKKRQGLRNRSQALLQLIELGRKAAQQTV